jgi:putative peptidoglycan lipid II flippase
MSQFGKSTLIVALFFGIDKLLGFARTIITTRIFGIGIDLDIFNAANNIPDLLSSLISGGALGVALIPVISEYLSKKGKPAAWDLFSRILNLAFLLTASFSIIIAIFAPWAVKSIIAPGFTLAQQALTTQILRLDLFAILIFSISGLVMAGLQANQHFLLPALAPGLYNIGQITGILLLAAPKGTSFAGITFPSMGLGVKGMAYGVIFGAFLHLLIQIPGLIKYQFRWTKTIDLKNEGVQQVLKLMGPRVLTMFFIQFFFIFRDNLASTLSEGSITALNQGWFIMQVPETLIGTAIAIAILPTLSEYISKKDYSAFSNTLNQAIRIIIGLTIPIAILISIGIAPIVQLVFNTSDEITQMVVLATRMYLAGLTGHALLEIASRSFYAQQNAKIPLFAAAINAVSYFFLSSFLKTQYGLGGIAFANVFIFTTEAILLLFILRKKFPNALKVIKTIKVISLPTLIIASAYGLILQSDFYWAQGLSTQAIISAAGMATSGILLIPFIYPEIKSLFQVKNSLFAK